MSPSQLAPGQEPQDKPVTAVIILCWFLILVFLLQGDHCIMGQQRSYRKRKSTSWCVKGRSFTSALTSRVCKCRDSDFLWWALPLPPGCSSIHLMMILSPEPGQCPSRKASLQAHTATSTLGHHGSKLQSPSPSPPSRIHCTQRPTAL